MPVHRPLPLIPAASEVLLSPEDREFLERIPPTISEVIRRMYVTGAVSSISQAQASLRSLFSIDLPDQIISYIMNKNMENWFQQRCDYLEQTERQHTELQVRLQGSPLDTRHYHLLTKLEMVTQAQADKLFTYTDDEQTISILKSLVDISDKLIGSFRKIPSIDDVKPLDTTEIEETHYEGEGKKVMQRVVKFTDDSRRIATNNVLDKFKKKTEEFVESISEEREL